MKLLCCPEDLHCARGCKEVQKICSKCRFPVCRTCRLGLHSKAIVPAALSNDMMLGYLNDFIYSKGVRCIECACASAFWNSLVVFRIDGARGHFMEAPIGRADRKPMVRGHLLSFPLDWLSVMQQLDRASVDRRLVSLPHTGSILATLVQVQISSSAIDVTKYLKQDSVRAEIVIQLIQLLKNSGHPDY